METTVLKKRLNTYKASSGRLTRVDDEVVMEVLRAWENWPGSTADLYRELGLSKMQLVVMIQKAKRLVKKGVIAGSDFKEITVSGGTSGQVQGIELSLANGKLIRFYEVGQAVEFLKRMESDDNV